MPRKIIIDTDPGIDDAMAIIYALASPELDVIGLTTVFGNAYVEHCTANAFHILEAAPTYLSRTVRVGRWQCRSEAPRLSCTARTG